MEQSSFIIAIKHSSVSGNFFIDFSTEDKYVVSIKISEAYARMIARELGLKIMEG